MGTADSLLLNSKDGNTYFKLLVMYRLHCYNVIDFIFVLKNVFYNLANNVILLPIQILICANLTVITLYTSTQVCFIIPNKIINHIFVRHSCIGLFDCAIFYLCLTGHCLLGLTMKSIFCIL